MTPTTQRFVLVPGAGGDAWLWHRVVEELGRRGHRAVAVELPGPDPDAGLDSYRRLIIDAARGLDSPLRLVAQSLGAFSAPLACAELTVEELILVNPMIPAPGEPAGQWWETVGWADEAQAAAEREGRPEVDVDDAETLFFHDLPPDVVEVMRSGSGRPESAAVFGEPWPLDRWPEVPTRVLAGRDDRLFPITLQRRVSQERLGVEVEELPGGHLLTLSQPTALVDLLTRVKP